MGKKGPESPSHRSALGGSLLQLLLALRAARVQFLHELLACGCLWPMVLNVFSHAFYILLCSMFWWFARLCFLFHGSTGFHRAFSSWFLMVVCSCLPVRPLFGGGLCLWFSLASVMCFFHVLEVYQWCYVLVLELFGWRLCLRRLGISSSVVSHASP